MVKCAVRATCVVVRVYPYMFRGYTNVYYSRVGVIHYSGIGTRDEDRDEDIYCYDRGARSTTTGIAIFFHALERESEREALYSIYRYIYMYIYICAIYLYIYSLPTLRARRRTRAAYYTGSGGGSGARANFFSFSCLLFAVYRHTYLYTYSQARKKLKVREKKRQYIYISKHKRIIDRERASAACSRVHVQSALLYVYGAASSLCRVCWLGAAIYLYMYAEG